MSKDTVPVEKVQELIDAYWEYERECMGGAATRESSEWRAVSRGRAALYRTVIADLEKLLPKKTLADFPYSVRGDFQWSEAYDTEGTHFVIAKVMKNCVTALWVDGLVTTLPHDEVTPLTDRPKARMPWHSDFY